ncbi:hypothetical protein MTR67_002518 [Solanum verrucosum]|uniref:Integrase zinc-binding domain-containing protein n=1 Tax=Solanum verrucosum TaxID=315347 RepID=A0AAF0PQ64_SOLVR|nr:hypothetical protein MTR67_002518 [Solanum verrucosum]
MPCQEGPSLKGVVHQQKVGGFSQGGDGVLRYQGRLCVPNVGELRQQILIEAHNSRYSINASATKMYRDLQEVFWWNGMKRDIEDFVAKCPNCQQVRVEHHKPGVDRVTKSAYFLAVKTIDLAEDYAKLYINEIVRLHGILLSIISDRGPQFTSHFWKSFQKGLGTQVSPMNGVIRFGKKGKLSPRYVGPYRILKRVGNVAYELELPAQLATVHPIFHISLLKKCVDDLASIVTLKSGCEG